MLLSTEKAIMRNVVGRPSASKLDFTLRPSFWGYNRCNLAEELAENKPVAPRVY